MRKYNIKHGNLVNINNLKYIAVKESMELNDVIKILGISEYNSRKIKANPFNNTKVNIFDRNKLKEIKVAIKSDVMGMKRYSQKTFDRLSKKYNISEDIVCNMLNISKTQKSSMKKGKKYINVVIKKDDRKIMNEVFINEVKYNADTDKSKIDIWKKKYKLQTLL